MSAVPKKNKRERQPASQSPARHSGEGGNTPTSSFRTPRSGDPESSAFAPARHSGAGRNPVAAGSIQRTPMSWHETTLGEILPLKYGKARSQDAGYSRPNTQTFGSNGVFGTFDRALTERPSIIVGRKGAAGLVHYSAEPCWPIDTAFYTEGSDQTYLPFFRYLLESLRLGQFDRSTAIPSLSRDDYNARKITYPERIDEQRCIVAEIEKQFTRLDAGVVALRRVQANLRRYRAAVLKAACEGRLVPTEAELARAEGRTCETGEQLLARILADRSKNWHGRGKYKEPFAPDTTSLPPLPEGWAWATCAQVGEAITGFTPPKSNTEFFGGDVPFLKPTDLGAGYNIREFRDSLTEAGAQHGRVLPPLSVLVTCIGATIGKTGLARVRCTTNQQINALVVSDKFVSAKYVYWYFCGPFGQRQILDNASATTLPILNKRRFEALPFPLPPLAEQARVVAEVERRLSVIEELETAVTANLQRAIRLRQSVLQRAFSEQ